MAALESCPKHNMIAYLEKTAGNAEFHEIIDFLTRRLIHYALTVSPVVSTTFVEQFWMSAKSKTINNVRYITAKIAGKSVTISEASIRSDLLFDDADGIDTLNNQAIFDTIQLMGGKNFSGNVTPLFDSMLVQPTKDEGEASKRPSESQPIPSPPHPGEEQPESQTDPSPKPSPLYLFLIPFQRDLVGIIEVTAQTKEIKNLKTQIKKLKKKARPVISHHKAWMKSVSMKTRLIRKKSMKKNWMQKESVSKQGRKSAKSKPTAHKDPIFDDLNDIDRMDYMETEDAYNEKGVSTKDQVSNDKPKVSTDKPKVSSDQQNVSTDKLDEGTAEPKDGNSKESATPTAPTTTSTPTLTVFGDDETIAEFLVSLLTLKPLPKIDPKDKGKKVLEEEAESDAESKGVNEAERKFAQLANDEEIARKIMMTSRLELKPDNALLAASSRRRERKVHNLERAKLLHDTIAAQESVSYTKKSAEIKRIGYPKSKRLLVNGTSKPFNAGSSQKLTKPTKLDVSCVAERQVLIKEGKLKKSKDYQRLDQDLTECLGIHPPIVK
ncbi:hypothetical protein Tco_1157538 [Tanacetum coccineum]